MSKSTSKMYSSTPDCHEYAMTEYFRPKSDSHTYILLPPLLLQPGLKDAVPTSRDLVFSVNTRVVSINRHDTMPNVCVRSSVVVNMSQRDMIE